MEKNLNLKQIQEFFSKPLEENTFKVGDKITYLGHPGEITATKEYNGRNFVSVSYDKGKGKTKASDILTTDGTVKAVAEGFKDYLGYSSVEVSRPTQDQVDRFFALTQNETHYLNSKPVAGQEKTFNKMEVEPWDEYDLSNWNSLVRKAKAKGKSLDEAKVDYDFSERELIRVLRQLKRGASTEVDMIKAFTKALGRDLTKDELFSESIAKINEATEEDKIDIVTMDVPLFIRALEYAKEDAQEDMDLHDFAERAILATKEQGILQMDDYDMLVGSKEPIDESVNLKQSKLSSSEYQKAKKLKAFDAKDWKWNADEDLYIKVVNESVNLKQSKLSSSEYQKAKKLKAFDAKDWKWNADEDLYIKVVNESVVEKVIAQLKEEKPGLWANIRAKKARGEKPAHGNSDASKSAKKAGKKINSLTEEEGVPHYTKDGKEWKGKTHKMPDDSLMSGNPHDKNGSGPNGKSEKLFHKEDLNEINEGVDMAELEFTLKRTKKENPGKKIGYAFFKDAPKGYRISINGKYTNESVNEAAKGIVKGDEAIATAYPVVKSFIA
jgi:hypothetical protein